MKKRTFLYIPLVFLFTLVISALGVHLYNIQEVHKRVQREARLPFGYMSGEVISVTPETDVLGIKMGDHITAINGRELGNGEQIYDEELSKMRGGQPISLQMERKTASGAPEKYETVVTPVAVVRDFSFYSQMVVNILFSYFFPAICILLGFWVVFVRPADHLAWILLFVLLGLSSLALEMYPSNTFVGAYQDVAFAGWALAMLLFGIYFPERLTFDRKLPWLKWILIVPLSFQVLITLFSVLNTFAGINVFPYIRFLTRGYNEIAFFVNMIAIACFFAALGYKSGTLQNPDARRRLRLMLYGTSLAITPSFLIILYKAISGAKGSFYDVVPFGVALTALVLMMLFPLTMAYVIVVHRAMDVSVVVRQGLQYALAKNGVFALQIILSVAVALTALSFASDEGRNRPQQIIFIAGGVMFIFLIRLLAEKIKIWTDRKFFREAYNAEQILSELSEDVRTMVETKPLLETVSTKISESLHVPQVILLLKNGNSFQAAHSLGYENVPSASLDENDKTIEKLKKNETLVIYQDDTDSWIHEEVQADEREKLQRLNSQLLLPIGAKNELSGVLSLSPKRSEEPYSPNDLRLLKSVASQTGLALENSRLTEAIASEAAQKERLNRELEIAREVQERLFPQELPAIEGLDYYGACRPALGVGGDYYDFLELPDSKFGIAIGDVSGKGIGASLMMASLQASLRGQAIHCGSDLAALMKHVNTLVYEASTSNRYATFFYAQYDIKTKKLIYVNAGHNPPLVIRANGEVLKLEEGGAVVGMLPTMFVNYTQGEVQLETGDLLVGSTDGITEAMNPQEEEWSEDAMLEELKKVYGKTSAEILPHIVAEADKFANGAKQHDDMTMIIVNVI